MLPSLETLSISCPRYFTKFAMSDSAAGSSAVISRFSPISISSIASLVLKTGSGQYKPKQSSFLSTLTVTGYTL